MKIKDILIFISIQSLKNLFLQTHRKLSHKNEEFTVLHLEHLELMGIL
jgi:hypothetical protein